MHHTLFSYLVWANPKSTALSEEQLFYDANASLFPPALSGYNDNTSLFGIVKSDILLFGLKTKKTIDEAIKRLSEDSLRDPLVQKALFQGLPFFDYKGTRIYIPSYGPVLNERYFRQPFLFKAFPYDAVLRDKDVSLVAPFDTYGNRPFASPFTRLVEVYAHVDGTKAYYHPAFQTVFVIDDQGYLEKEIPLVDEKLKGFDGDGLFLRLHRLMDAYFREDEALFLRLLLQERLVSASFHKELVQVYEKERRKKERRMRTDAEL